ncbi:glucose 1-dehydrogenase [Siminovitchia sp. 179-K 8D1 HS]|uniref:glucose 1-dehydrogenase n=1 Tax=Siminovitchia sp. 179-K 8D1 HS TaxID=3142385 RepID=UPI00399F6CA6
MEMLKKLFSLEGKTILVTGGAQGIGREIANHAAAIGADVVIFDLQGKKAEQAAKEIAETYGRRTYSRQVDVTDYEGIKTALKQAVKEMGQIELLFNNAGIVIQKPVIESSPEEWKKVIDVNLNGVYYVAQLFGKYLIETGIKGSIVNTASMSGIIVNYPQLQASYNTSKAGVTHLTKSLAYEWAEHGIRVNCISPGYMFTELTSFVREDWREKWAELTPMKRLGKPEELAGAVIYLLSDSASFTTGCELVVDGGFTII